MYVTHGNEHRFRLCECRGDLETNLMNFLIPSEEVACLGQSRRIDIVKIGECGFEGGSLSFQQLNRESDYGCRTRRSMEYLGNSSAK